MRTFIFALASSALIAGAVVAGCSSSSNGDMTPIILRDMTMVPLDISSTKLGCKGYVDCYINCATTATTSAEYTTCTMNCDTNAKSTVHNSSGSGTYDKVIGCGQLYCLGGALMPDMPYKCELDTTNHFTEVGGGMLTYDMTTGNPTSPCAKCLNDVESPVLGFPCTTMSSVDCLGTTGSAATTACGTYLNTCLADM